MKRIGKKICFVLLCALLLSLCSCSGFYDSESVRPLTDEFLEAVIDDDRDAAYSLMKDSYDEDEEAFDKDYSDWRELLGDVDEYTLKAIKYNSSTEDGMRYTGVVYKLTAGEEVFVIDSVISSSEEGLSRVYVNTFDAAVADEYIVVEKNGIVNVIFLVILLAELAFMAFVIVDCAKHKMFFKWLWMLVIILGWVAVNIYISPELSNFKFNFLSPLGTYIHFYSDSSIDISVSVPVGLIVYLFKRKKLFAQYEEELREREKRERRNNDIEDADNKDTES